MPKNIVPLVYLALIIVAFYFLMIRPQRQRMRRTDALQAQLAVGDEVMLTSGIFGTIAAIEDDGILVTVADGVDIRVDRRAVGTTTRRQLDNHDPDVPDDDLEPPDDADRVDDDLAELDRPADQDRPDTLDRPDRGAS